jgi:hypothetical protein
MISIPLASISFAEIVILPPTNLSALFSGSAISIVISALGLVLPDGDAGSESSEQEFKYVTANDPTVTYPIPLKTSLTKSLREQLEFLII